MGTAPEASAPTAHVLTRPSFKYRAAAVIVDSFVLWPLLITVGWSALGLSGLVVVAGLFYLIEGLTGWSPGKLGLSMRIRNADGTRAPRWRLLVRCAVKNIGFVLGAIAFVAGVDSMSMLGFGGTVLSLMGGLLILGPARQALHDKLLRTAVYRTPWIETRRSA